MFLIERYLFELLKQDFSSGNQILNQFFVLPRNKLHWFAWILENVVSVFDNRKVRYSETKYTLLLHAKTELSRIPVC